MFEKIKYKTIDYGLYNQLKVLFLSNDFNPLEVYELNLANSRSKLMPPIKCLELLNNLSILILNNNLISRFDGNLIAKNLPNLALLDL